jgi:hypothetical protein
MVGNNMSGKPMKPKQKVWDQELQYATQPQYWKSFAQELEACAVLLGRNWRNHLEDIGTEGGMTKMFFAPKFIRMLWGFALENLLKGILLEQDSEKYLTKAGNISWGKTGHDLWWLMEELRYSPIIPSKWNDSVDVKMMINAWSVSATWYGKYPFPMGMNGVLGEYKDLSSSEALLERQAKGEKVHFERFVTWRYWTF